MIAKQSFRHHQNYSVDQRFVLTASLIIILGLWLRTEALLRLPSFIDEVIHLDRSHDVLRGLIFSGNIRKWLYPVVLSLFQPTGPEGLWVGRAISAWFSAVTMASCIALGKSFGSRRAGLLAGIFYVLLPLAFFHERQALADSLLAAFTSFSTVLILWVARHPRLWLAVPLGVLLALANLTKIAALPYLGLPIAGIILLTPPRVRLRSILTATLALLLTVALGAIAYRASVLVEKQQRNPEAQVTTIRLSDLISASPYQVLQMNLQRLTTKSGQNGGVDFAGGMRDFLDVQWHYVGLPLLLLITLAILWSIRERRAGGVLYLAVPGLVFAIVPLIAVRPTGFLAARYLVSTGPPLAVLGALGFHWTLGRTSPRESLTRWAGAVAVLGLIIGPAFPFAAHLMSDPGTAPLAHWDQEQYIDGRSGGSGSDELTWSLADRWRQEGAGRRLYVLSNGFRLRLASLLGPRAAYIEDYDSLGSKPPLLLVQTLASAQPVYVVDAREKAPLPESPFGARLALIETSESAKSPMFLYQIIGAQGNLADAVFTASAPDTSSLTDEYAALTDYLKQDPPPATLAIFPGSHAEMLGALDAQGITATDWPLDSEAAAAALDQIQLGADASLVDVILVDEAKLDPDRQMLLALQGRWFFVSESWFGLLHEMRFISGPQNLQFTPQNAVWEDAIHLSAASILDPDPQSGDILRLALQWETDIPIQDSFKVFVHVIDPEGTLRAQYDGLPGNGLLPMTGWLPHDHVQDHITITLPDDLPPGTYDLVAGIYQPESGLRLRVTAGASDSPDSILLGQISVATQP